MLDWVREHRVLLSVLGGTSLLTFVASVVLIPLYFVRMSPDHFCRARRPSRLDRAPHWVRLMLTVLKNVLAVVFIIAGLAMLALPGQGLLTLVIGVLLLDFPGKHRVEQWMLSRRQVMAAINWLRAKAKRPPLVAPVAHEAPRHQAKGAA